MISKIIQKEKGAQDAILTTTSPSARKMHKEVLTDLKEYMEEQSKRWISMVPSDNYIALRDNSIIQLKEDIQELTKMIERY